MQQTVTFGRAVTDVARGAAHSRLETGRFRSIPARPPALTSARPSFHARPSLQVKRPRCLSPPSPSPLPPPVPAPPHSLPAPLHLPHPTPPPSHPPPPPPPL